LREGEYTVVIDTQTLPEEITLATPASLQVLVSGENTSPAAIEFRLEPKPQVENPIRQILREQIHISSPKFAPAPADAGEKR
jgi:hypothetical protein